MEGATRYNELRRRMGGISNTMLAKSLKELEDAGLRDWTNNQRMNHSPRADRFVRNVMKPETPTNP